MTRKQKELIKKATKKWGQEIQIEKIKEEALELALALQHLKSPTKEIPKVLDNVYEELGDMKIMLHIAEIVFDKERINNRVKEKLERLESKYFSKKC